MSIDLIRRSIACGLRARSLGAPRLKQESDIPCITAFSVRTAVLRELGGFNQSYSVAQDMKVIAEVAFRYSVFVADALQYGVSPDRRIAVVTKHR